MRPIRTVKPQDIPRASPPGGDAGSNSDAGTQPSAIQVLLDASRHQAGGSVEALLQHCRAYLLEIANAEVAPDLRVSVAPSDLVQETFAEAVKAFPQFRGTTEAELRGWLRRILLHNITDSRRYYLETKKRQPGNLLSLQQSSVQEWIGERLIDPVPSPSKLAQGREWAEKLRAAIDRLPDDYRLVVRLRHFEGLPLARVGEHLGRSPDAVRKLWFRGIEKLRELMENESDGGR